MFDETFYRTYNYVVTDSFDRVWLPENSMVESDTTSITIQSEYPCYYDSDIPFDNNIYKMIHQLGIDSCTGANQGII